ncbi:MAG: (5-formylfuran-3-yl)methyl phosphate synthase, partial [Planctomycetaceae bacterium]
MSGSPGRWSGLLVSVRDAAEAEEALAGGASIVDVKEPRRGPLGAASAATAAAVAGAVAGHAPWTLACGELAAGAEPAAVAADVVAALPPGVARPRDSPRPSGRTRSPCSRRPCPRGSRPSPSPTPTGRPPRRPRRRRSSR